MSIRRVWFLHLILFGGLTTYSCVAPSGPAAPLPCVVILHTNDLHGQARPVAEGRGGFPALAAKIKKRRAEEIAKGSQVFVVDCGDFFQGTPEGDLTGGTLVVDVFNEIGYDALCLGNHDFDFGPQVTEALARRARFPFLGANIIEESTGQPPPWIRSRVSFEDAHLEFVGLISGEMPLLTTEKARVGLRFPLEWITLERMAPAPRSILLTHCGHEPDFAMARKDHRFRAILGGHSHQSVSEVVEGTYVGQSGSRGTMIDVVRLDPTGTVSGHLEEVKVSEGEDPGVQAILNRYAPEIDRIMEVGVGELSEEVTREGRGSSSLGNWLCDLMREKVQAEVAFHNRTGIRASMKKGEIRERDLYQVSPFHNTLVTMKLTGRQIVQVLEHSVDEPRYLMEVAGLEFSYDPKAEKGKRVRDVGVGGEPLDRERVYAVVTNSFLAKGGSGFEAFLQGREAKDTLIDLLDLHRESIRASSPVRRPFSERIRVIE